MAISVSIHQTKLHKLFCRHVKHILFHFNSQAIFTCYKCTCICTGYMYIKAIRHALSIESNDAIMGCFARMFFIFGLVDCFVLVIAVEPHSKIKGI